MLYVVDVRVLSLTGGGLDGWTSSRPVNHYRLQTKLGS